MTLVKDVTQCSTIAVRGLDNQLIVQMNKIRPGLLVRIDDLNVQLGEAVHPWMQPAAKKRLAQAIAARGGKRIMLNSAYRTLAGQMLLRSHYENKRCGITAAALPGKSNHNNASAIDVQDWDDWKTTLLANGWSWLGPPDVVHFDCIDRAVIDTRSVAVKAFQQLWNIARPTNKLAVDGDFGPVTASRLRYSPAEGFPATGIPRLMLLTDPIQIGNDVGELQLALRRVGIKLDKADKIFGPATDKAVREYQAANPEVMGKDANGKPLPPDGIVGYAMRKALDLRRT